MRVAINDVGANRVSIGHLFLEKRNKKTKSNVPVSGRKFIKRKSKKEANNLGTGELNYCLSSMAHRPKLGQVTLTGTVIGTYTRECPYINSESTIFAKSDDATERIYCEQTEKGCCGKGGAREVVITEKEYRESLRKGWSKRNARERCLERARRSGEPSRERERRAAQGREKERARIRAGRAARESQGLRVYSAAQSNARLQAHETRGLSRPPESVPFVPDHVPAKPPGACRYARDRARARNGGDTVLLRCPTCGEDPAFFTKSNSSITTPWSAPRLEEIAGTRCSVWVVCQLVT
ncbi:uncharacterized protein LOC143178025 isoform X1 [Calliopsis andreniformis]|uniref:uncharacterized protein LOC143178025 isoform X1 n=1 Tax=Calliopsis andreniformis TaxID=337506 RepID=UPI003FCE4A82